MALERLSKMQMAILIACKKYIDKHHRNIIRGRSISFSVAKTLNYTYGGDTYTDPSFQASFSRSLRNLVKKGLIIPQFNSYPTYTDWNTLSAYNPFFRLSDKALQILNVKESHLNNNISKRSLSLNNKEAE